MPSVFRSLSRCLIGFILIFAGCEKKPDPTEAARKFFQQVGEGKTSEAYATSAFGFQAQQTERAFMETVKELGLANSKGLDVQPTEVSAHEAKLNASVTNQKGDNETFIVTLVFESGAWRVFSLRSPMTQSGSRSENRFTLVGKGAAFNDAQSQPMPDQSQIEGMVRQVVIQFDEALRDQSFNAFYEDVSLAWQKQLTVGQLQRAFQPFINAGVRFGGLDQAEMQFDGPPAINSEGILVVSGHLHTAPYQVYFSMKFIYELPRWKLFGLDINLQH